MTFVIPKEQKWVKQVLVAFPTHINDFLRSAVDDPSIRGETIMGMMKDQVMITYEEDLNAQTNTDE
jgi:hypothetical protein